DPADFAIVPIDRHLRFQGVDEIECFRSGGVNERGAKGQDNLKDRGHRPPGEMQQTGIRGCFCFQNRRIFFERGVDSTRGLEKMLRFEELATVHSEYKSEIRNPKSETNPKGSNPKSETRGLVFLLFGFWICFGFRF